MSVAHAIRAPIQGAKLVKILELLAILALLFPLARGTCTCSIGFVSRLRLCISKAGMFLFLGYTFLCRWKFIAKLMAIYFQADGNMFPS